MQDLALYFNPLAEEIAAETSSYADLYYAAEIYTHAFPRIQAESIVLIGLPDSLEDGQESYELVDTFRQHFYRLKRTGHNVLFYDVGNLRPGESPAQTQERLGVICSTLIDHGAVPLLVGAERSWMLGHFRAALDQDERATNLANIDASLDLDHEDGVLHRIVTLRQHLPSHFSQLAYQSYLVDPVGLALLEKLHFEALRLGQIHENFRVAEPLIRDADFLFFNLSALRNTAFVQAPGPRPFGLNGEQACQLCWYAGISARLKTIGFYNILPAAQHNDADLATLAIMIWHFLEGFSYRTQEQPTDDRYCDRHIVALPGYEDLLFFRSRRTDRWWMQVPDKSGLLPDGYMLPCLYEDYTQAVNGHLPDRWVRTFSRIN
jgi:formiminoglutamase